MPNWCNNGITIKHKDPAMIERMFNARESGILQEFFPCPAELHEHNSPMRDEALGKRFLEQYGARDWYDWQVSNWGTKWDLCDVMFERTDANTVSGGFDTAWAPPIQAYEKLCALGFEIEAFYNEPGMQFCGKVVGNEDEFFDDYMEYSGETSETIREVIGEELDDYFNISEDMAQWEEESND